MHRYLLTALCLLLPLSAALAQDQPDPPDVDVEAWTGKRVLLIGAHPDDDSYSHGTLSLLQENGNDVYVLLLTTGNVGTKDPTMSRNRLAQIRRQEQLGALAAIGVPADHYINLGYDDGRVEYTDREELNRRLVRWIRTIKPDVLFAFDPGAQEQRWHKADHRVASYMAADAARAAEWPLLFQGQIINEGLEAWQIPAYLFFDGNPEDQNLCVEVTSQVDKKIKASQAYVSQFTSAWEDYGAGPTQEDLDQIAERVRNRLKQEDGAYYECFRYYSGPPDGIGR